MVTKEMDLVIPLIRITLELPVRVQVEMPREMRVEARLLLPVGVPSKHIVVKLWTHMWFLRGEQ